MSIAAVARRAQAAAERLMVDTCTITRPSTTPGQPDVTVYTGKCRIRASAMLPTSEAASQSPTSLTIHRIDIPVSAPGITYNDKAHVDSSLNPTLVGAEAFIAGPMGQTAGSAQRLFTRESLR